MINADESKKQPRAKLFLLKARLLDMLPEYEKSAEEFLNKSVCDWSNEDQAEPGGWVVLEYAWPRTLEEEGYRGFSEGV